MILISVEVISDLANADPRFDASMLAEAVDKPMLVKLVHTLTVRGK